MSNRWVRILLSVLTGCWVTGIQILIRTETSLNPLWQVHLFHKLVGNGPILGYDTYGQPMYEGTPVHMMAAFAGIILGVFVYTAVGYGMLTYWVKTRRRNNTNIMNA